jgi:hypothetical protein
LIAGTLNLQGSGIWRNIDAAQELKQSIPPRGSDSSPE